MTLSRFKLSEAASGALAGGLLGAALPQFTSSIWERPLRSLGGATLGAVLARDPNTDPLEVLRSTGAGHLAGSVGGGVLGGFIGSAVDAKIPGSHSLGSLGTLGGISLGGALGGLTGGTLGARAAEQKNDEPLGDIPVKTSYDAGRVNSLQKYAGSGLGATLGGAAGSALGWRFGGPKGALIGGALGGVPGAILGNQMSDESSTPVGSALGSGIGSAAGTLAGGALGLGTAAALNHYGIGHAGGHGLDPDLITGLGGFAGAAGGQAAGRALGSRIGHHAAEKHQEKKTNRADEELMADVSKEPA